MGRKITQYPNNVSVTPDELSLIDVSEKTGLATYESRKWTLAQFKAWLNANITIPVVDGVQGQIPLFVQDDEIGGNTRFTFVDNEGTEVGFRFSDSAGNLTQVGVTYTNLESQGIASNSVLRLANWADNTNKGIVSFRKSRGTKSVPTQVLNGDILGHIIYAGQSDFGTGTTTCIVEVKALNDYTIYTDAFGYARNALTELNVFLAPSVNEGNLSPSGFPNNLVFSVNGDGLVKFLNYFFPISDGTNGQVLTTNGAGQLTWTNPSSGVNGSGANNRIAYWSDADTLTYSDYLQSYLGSAGGGNDWGIIRVDSYDLSEVFIRLGGIIANTYSNSRSAQIELNTENDNSYWSKIFLNFARTGATMPLINDVLGEIAFGSNYLEGGGIKYVATENHSDANLDLGSKMIFSIVKNTQHLKFDALILDSDGRVKISNSYKLPLNDGTNGQVLVTDGAGNVSWGTGGGSSSFIPALQGNEVFRGVTFANNSTSITSSGGITNNLSGSQFANSVATTNYRTKQHTMRFEPSVVSTGNYCCMRSSALLWSMGGGFYFVGEFGISDVGYAVGTHNFWGLTDSTSNLAIGGVSNSQPSALLNIIAVANDSGDANLQIMHNDSSGTATKIDLGASFPSNRTSGSALTNMYLVELYNAPSGTSVKYRVTNKETGAVAQGTITTNLPSTATLLAYQAGRSMGTSGGGVSSSGRYDVSRLGVYTI